MSYFLIFMCMSKINEFVKSLMNFVKNKVKDFLEKNSCGDKLPELEKRAIDSMSPCGYFNELTNGAVDKVAESTGRSHKEVMDEFKEFYFGTK